MNLTLLIDQGEDVQGPRWQAGSKKFQDLEEALAEAPEPALVILGPPGSGKSTLLRNFELEASHRALEKDQQIDPERSRCTFFIQLNEYKRPSPNAPLLSPHVWLKTRWSDQNPELPDLETLLQQGRMTLLLDALNEIPAAGSETVGSWKDFLAGIAQGPAGNRILFSCRSLDYSASLSTPERPVPQLRIEPLSDSQVREFVEAYAPDHGEKLWANLKDSKHLDLFRSPYYLKMLVDQSASGDIPEGRVGLFTGFIRQLLYKEYQSENPRFQPGSLVTQRDIQRLIQVRRGKSPSDLPENGWLVPKLSQLAHRMQLRHSTGEGGQVRVDYDGALELLEHEAAENILKAGIDLGVLIHDLERDEIRYIHQLLQEYFAARELAKNPNPDLVRQAWKSSEVSPSLEETLAALPDSDPLPPLPGSGWEETTVLAAAISAEPEAFIENLTDVNLPLAGRCAAEPEVQLSTDLKTKLARALIGRMRDRNTDLRARIAAGLSLGNLGDPRFMNGRGPHGDYLLPPFIDIPGGTYTIGSDEGLYANEAPARPVTLEPFSLAQFPVTNAEWRLFMAAGGYDDEQWWEGDAAKAWRSGENTAEGANQQLREERNYLQKNFYQIRTWYRLKKITSQHADFWEQIAQMGDDKFENLIDQWYPPGRQSLPRYWNDQQFSDPGQPVVGISWHEARAFCAWLSAQTGRDYRLPTEAEWEAAARGFKSRRYAWGNDFDSTHCNTFESHVRRPTPVGLYPDGETPDGLADISGNVWEWTQTIYKDYPYDAADGRNVTVSNNGRRVVRGGSWYNVQDLACAAYRYYFTPDFRYSNLGFR